MESSLSLSLHNIQSVTMGVWPNMRGLQEVHRKISISVGFHFFPAPREMYLSARNFSKSPSFIFQASLGEGKAMKCVLASFGWKEQHFFVKVMGILMQVDGLCGWPWKLAVSSCQSAMVSVLSGVGNQT